MNNNSISYLEIACSDLSASKVFFRNVFGWSFHDYGSEYSAFSGAIVNGGFYQSSHKPEKNSVLVVLYHSDLDAIKATIKKHGGQISREIFAFPGGHRFHFLDPSGQEYAVWSEQYDQK